MGKKSKYILLILGLAIFSYLVYDFGVANIIVNIKKMGWWFAAVAGVWAAVYFCNAKAWFAILHDHVDGVSFFAIYKLTVTGFAINYITPFLNLGGEPYRVVELQKKAGTHRAVSSVILYNMVRMVSYFLFWFLAVVMMFLFFSPTGSFAAALIVVFLFVLGLFFLFLAGHKNGIFALLFSWIDRHPFLQKATKPMESKRNSLLVIDEHIRQLYNTNRKTFYTAVGYELLARFISTFEFIFILTAIGFHPSYGEALYINAASSLIINLFFFMPFELGTREGGLFLVMQTIGYAPGIGIVIGLVNRLRELVWLFIGLAFMVRTGAPKEERSILEMMEVHKEL